MEMSETPLEAAEVRNLPRVPPRAPRHPLPRVRQRPPLQLLRHDVVFVVLLLLPLPILRRRRRRRGRVRGARVQPHRERALLPALEVAGDAVPPLEVEVRRRRQGLRPERAANGWRAREEGRVLVDVQVPREEQEGLAPGGGGGRRRGLGDEEGDDDEVEVRRRPGGGRRRRRVEDLHRRQRQELVFSEPD